MSKVRRLKEQLLDDIIHCRNSLDIETLFGQEVWNVFQTLLGGSHEREIVVCGNGPVAQTSRYGEEINSTDMVIRCNNYLAVHGDEAARAAVGRKCDVHLICLQGVEFKKDGLRFLREWCKETSCVLAMENSPARKPILRAIQTAIADGDEFFSKVRSFREDMEGTLFPTQCTRGFLGIAFALQAKRRLGLSRPVKCIGFGGSGHHNNASQPMYHQHHQELQILRGWWNKADDLVHLEWAEVSGELMKSATLTKQPFPELACSTAEEMGDVCVMRSVTALATHSKYYKSVPLDQIQALVAKGLIVHPQRRDYLTCEHHLKKGRHLELQTSEMLLEHFAHGHSEPCKSQPVDPRISTCCKRKHLCTYHAETAPMTAGLCLSANGLDLIGDTDPTKVRRWRA
jgi:hypothetical protein